MSEVEKFLRLLLDEEGPGCRGFGLHGEYLPNEVAIPDTLSAIAELIRHTLDNPRSVTGIAWDNELITSWRSRLEPMLKSVEDSARNIP